MLVVAVLVVAGLIGPNAVEGVGNIGCLFSNTLCENEWCFDDYAFGKCFPVEGQIQEKDLIRYHLTETDLHTIEAEMQRLYHLGYRWSHTYTQCVLQDLLSDIHQGKSFDVSGCNDQLDQDLEGALRAIEGEEEETVNPRDLAIVRFAPSVSNPHSAFADEFYFPAIQGGKMLPAPFRGAENKTTPHNSGIQKDSGPPSSEQSKDNYKDSNKHVAVDKIPPIGNHKSSYGPYDLDYDLFPVSEKSEVFYDYPHEVNSKEVFGVESPYPKEGDQPPPRGFNDHDKYYGVPYDNTYGYVNDQGYGNDDETNDVLYYEPKSEEAIPTIQSMSNKEYMRKLGFHVPDIDENVRVANHNHINPRNPIPRNPNHYYHKRANSTSKAFNLQNFMRKFNQYLKDKYQDQDITNNQAKREGHEQSINGLKPIQGLTSSKMRALQEKLDPQMKEELVNKAIDVMRRNRENPQYNTAELKKIANLLDSIWSIQKGPSEPLPVRYVERKETEPLYAEQILPARRSGNPEEPGEPLNPYERLPAAYLRVDKAIPFGSYGQNYPDLTRGLQERYTYASPELSYYGEGGGRYFPTEGEEGEGGNGLDGEGKIISPEEGGEGGEPGDEMGGKAPPPMYYHRPPYRPLYPPPHHFTGEHRPHQPYDRNSISSIVDDDTAIPADEFTYDNHENGFGSQLSYPHFFNNYDYGEEVEQPGAPGDDPMVLMNDGEGDKVPRYPIRLDADGNPRMNFDRPERHDVKKPGPNFNTNNYGFNNEYFDDYYQGSYDYPDYRYYPMDPYPHYGGYGADYLDETMFGPPNAEPSKDGRYYDENGNEIDIGLAPGNGGMIPMSRPNFEQTRFQETLSQEGLEGSSLHPGPNHKMYRNFHHGQIPDLMLTDEMLVDNISRGIGGPHHGQRPHPLMDAMMPHGPYRGQTMVPANGSHPDADKDLSPPVPTYIYIDVNMSFSNEGEALDLASWILHKAGLGRDDIKDLRVEDNRMLFTLKDNLKGVSEQDIAHKAEELADSIYDTWKVQILRSGVASSQGGSWSMLEGSGSDNSLMVGAAVVSGVMAALVVAAAVVMALRKHAARRSKLHGLSNRDTEASKDYQDLCRARMAAKNKSSTNSDREIAGTHSAAGQRISNLSKDNENGGTSPGSRSSTSSWSEEPVAPNMDISTGHMVLSYMEDHLKNKSRLEQEWVALTAYEAEPSATMVAKKPTNQKKNRYPGVLPYDHNRVHLNQQANISGSDYINASSITDHDPRHPAYIATQGPLATTSADFWQLVWEQGSVVIVMLTKLNENGHTLCHHYWPQEGSQLYHIYEVNLVSEHIWCDDYLVRSFYLKNVRTGETRTITQFHFLSWPDTAIPASTKALLEFRSDGIGRAGTYILIDMVLNRMAKGAKEIDIAATLEHIRDQRGNMVTTKLQFEFVLMAVAEEVHAILKALPQ